jgi:hypothetical protein
MGKPVRSLECESDGMCLSNVLKVPTKEVSLEKAETMFGETLCFIHVAPALLMMDMMQVIACEISFPHGCLQYY